MTALPEEFTAAAEKMRTAFVSGTDIECEDAAADLTRRLHTLPEDQVPTAEELLATLAATASAERAAHRIRSQLPTATPTGTRPLTPGHEVRTLRLADGSEVAIVVPTGDAEGPTLARESLLCGHCRTCQAQIGADLQLRHRGSCPASRTGTRRRTRRGGRRGHQARTR